MVLSLYHQKQSQAAFESLIEQEKIEQAKKEGQKPKLITKLPPTQFRQVDFDELNLDGLIGKEVFYKGKDENNNINTNRIKITGERDLETIIDTGLQVDGSKFEILVNEGIQEYAQNLFGNSMRILEIKAKNAKSLEGHREAMQVHQAEITSMVNLIKENNLQTPEEIQQLERHKKGLDFYINLGLWTLDESTKRVNLTQAIQGARNVGILTNYYVERIQNEDTRKMSLTEMTEAFDKIEVFETIRSITPESSHNKLEARVRGIKAEVITELYLRNHLPQGFSIDKTSVEEDLVEGADLKVNTPKGEIIYIEVKTTSKDSQRVIDYENVEVDNAYTEAPLRLIEKMKDPHTKVITLRINENNPDIDTYKQLKYAIIHNY